MSKFCTSCGSQLADDAVFCTTCGAQQGQSQQPQQGQQGQPQSNPANNFAAAASGFAQGAAGTVKQTFDGVSFDSVKGAMTIDNIKNVGKTKNKNTIIGLSAIAVVLIIIVIILAAALSGGYKDPIDNLFKAYTKSDGKAFARAMPDAINEYVEDEVMSDDYDSIDEYYEEMLLDDYLDSYEDDYGSDIKFTYKVVKKKEIKKSDLEDVEDSINDNYDADVNVTKGYKVKIKLKIKGDEDDDTESTWINVYKIDGQWCLTGSSF